MGLDFGVAAGRAIDGQRNRIDPCGGINMAGIVEVAAGAAIAKRPDHAVNITGRPIGKDDGQRLLATGWFG